MGFVIEEHSYRRERSDYVYDEAEHHQRIHALKQSAEMDETFWELIREMPRVFSS